MPRYSLSSWLIACCLLFVSCASLDPDYDEPVVEITGLIPASSDNGLAFQIKLRVINPNAKELAFNGIFYQLKFEGHNLLSGTAEDLPIIPGYGEADIILSAQPSLLGGLRLLTELASRSHQGALEYELDIKLDVRNHLTAYRIRRQGTLDPGGIQSAQSPLTRET